MGTVTKVIGSAKGFYDVARYLKKDRKTGADRDTGFRMGYNVSPEPTEAAREMAQAAQGRLMHEPCLHVVLSPEPLEGGRLGPAELEHMVGDLTREMGWQDYQVLAVEHLDTDHQHVHLMINRAHPLHTGESIDGYYLYKGLRRWAQDFDERRQLVELESRQEARAAHAREVGVGLERMEAGLVVDDAAPDQAAEGYVAKLSPEMGRSATEHAAGDRAPSPRDPHGRPDHVAEQGSGSDGMGQRQGSESSAQPSGQDQHCLTNLSTRPEKTGLDRELSAIAELERLAHEKEMALAMLKADARHRETSGQALLSDDERRQLRQTAREIDGILKRQQDLVDPEPRRPAKAEPAAKAPAPDLSERVAESYRDLLDEARPYWMHPEAAVRDMKDLAALRGHEAVTWAIKHEPEAFNERTTAPLSEAHADRIAGAYRRYEAYRRQYVAEAMAQLDLHGEKAPTQPALARSTGAPSKDPARGNGTASKRVDPVERAEELFYRDVASRLLEERTEDVQIELGKAMAHAERLHEAVRERAYHHLHTALRATYKDPAEAFKRLEAYHRRGQADLVLRKPELLGEMKRVGVRERVRRETPRRRAADLVRRYGVYVDGPEARGQVASARERVERLQEQLKVLDFAQRRIGTPEAVQKEYVQVHQTLTAEARARLDQRLCHLPGAQVRRRSEKLLAEALRRYPGAVRAGQIRGLASQKAVGRAMGKAARNVGATMGLKQPLQFAMRAGGLLTRAASAVYRGARTFFER